MRTTVQDGELYIITASQTNPLSNTATKTVSITEGTIKTNASIQPLQDSTWNLGSSSIRWDNLYVDSITSGSGANISNLNASNLSSGTVPAARLSNVTVASSAADVLSTSTGTISADDAGADKLVFWDDSASKLKYLSFSDLTALP